MERKLLKDAGKLTVTARQCSEQGYLRTMSMGKLRLTGDEKRSWFACHTIQYYL